MIVDVLKLKPKKKRTIPIIASCLLSSKYSHDNTDENILIAEFKIDKIVLTASLVFCFVNSGGGDSVSKSTNPKSKRLFK